MKVIEVMKSCCNLLELGDTLSVLEQTTTSNQTENLANTGVKKLFNLTQFAIQELCTNYVPISNIVSVTTSDKKYLVSNLTNFIRLQNVYQDGEAVDFKLINRYLTMEQDGTYDLKYLTYPTITLLYDELEFLNRLGSDVLVFGICAYYCLSVGMFDDFNEFHDRYVEKANALKDLRNFNMPTRRWE